ncbi:MAG: hypothetical protein NTX50_17475 [Candidatus Sumerlaeota bacterium]|nr:hypothetical protein [Candidatus Sumerlaeota bacterium]
MATAQQLAYSILLDNGGVHLLLWDDKDNLYRELIILLAALDSLSINPLLLSSGKQTAGLLREIFELKPPEEGDSFNESTFLDSTRRDFLVLFIQQATSSDIGPWLNGWRNALAQKPGSLLIVRQPELRDFERNASDLLSYIGPKIYDCSSMLPLWNEETAMRIQAELSGKFQDILQKLPGSAPDLQEIKEWLQTHTPAALKG